MKTSIYVAEAVFLLTVSFYGVRSWKSLNETDEPQLRVIPEDKILTIPSDEMFILYCYFVGNSDSKRMEWINPRGEILPDGLHLPYLTSVLRTSSLLGLTIFNPLKIHSGKYTCSAEYNVTSDPGSIKKVETSVNITVLDKPSISKFSNVTVEEGRRFVLSCYARSDPAPNITIWKADDPDFPENEDGRIEVKYFPWSEANEVTVAISEVKKSDEGYYYCTAEANGFYSNKTAYLEVEFAPNMTATPPEQLLTRSGNVTNLTCIAEANPPAVITWEFQNKEIDPENQHNVVYGRTVISKLLIHRNDTGDIQSNVYGIYKCTARNRLGSRNVNITLQEVGVPGEITQVVIHSLTPRSIYFVFVGPSNDGGRPITAYVANYSTPEDYQDSVTEWPAGSSYVLKNLKPGANYTFNVAAKNSVGIGAWKTIDYVMPNTININDTNIEPNTLITKDVNITDYPDRYEIRWKVHDDYGMLKRYFVVTYFNDGRIKVDHQNGNITFPL